MKTIEANLGRVFILVMEDNEILQEKIKNFVEEKGIETAQIFINAEVKEIELKIGYQNVKITKNAHAQAMGYIAKNDEKNVTIQITGTVYEDNKALYGQWGNNTKIASNAEIMIQEIVTQKVKIVYHEDTKTKIIRLNEKNRTTKIVTKNKNIQKNIQNATVPIYMLNAEFN